jgi:hypothetical protein
MNLEFVTFSVQLWEQPKIPSRVRFSPAQTVSSDQEPFRSSTRFPTPRPHPRHFGVRRNWSARSFKLLKYQGKNGAQSRNRTSDTAIFKKAWMGFKL